MPSKSEVCAEKWRLNWGEGRFERHVTQRLRDIPVKVASHIRELAKAFFCLTSSLHLQYFRRLARARARVRAKKGIDR